MKINNNFVLRQLGLQYVAVPFGEELQDFRGMIKLNETAAKMWDFLREDDRTEEELVAFLVDSYAISQEEAQEDAQAFLAILTENGLLENA